MKLLFLIMNLFFLPALTFSQAIILEVISSAGDYFNETNTASIHWTVGEVMTGTYTNEEVLTEGFHQKIDLATSVYNNPSMEYDFKVFPNPAIDWVNIESQSKKAFKLVFYDLYGRVLLTENFKGPINRVDLSALHSGSYFLSIYHKDELVQIYKLQILKP